MVQRNNVLDDDQNFYIPLRSIHKLDNAKVVCLGTFELETFIPWHYRLFITFTYNLELGFLHQRFQTFYGTCFVTTQCL